MNVEYRIDETGFGTVKIKQNPEGFCYGVDAVMLAAFAQEIWGNRSTKNRRIGDLGTGNGIVPLVLSHKMPGATIFGLEVMPENAALAAENVLFNHLEERLRIVEGNVTDLRQGNPVLEAMGGRGSFDIVTSNPPYTKANGGIPNGNALKYVARQEVKGTLRDFVEGAATLLRDKGEFFMVHRPNRLVDIVAECRKARLEPKTLRMISGKPGEAPNILLVHCVKNGNPQMNVLPQEAVREENGEYTRWMRKNYE